MPVPKPTIEDLIVTVSRLKAQQDRLAGTLGEAQQQLIAAFEAEGIETRTVKTLDGQSLKATLVKGSTVSIDSDRLKGALSAAMWKKITKPVLDKEALEAHVATGDIAAEVVASCSEVKHSKPYVRLPAKADAEIETPPVRKVRKPSAARSAVGR